ncbi:Y-family DNA polymerase [Paracoccus albus]|uniref:Y-family DNA polymerase n=1 Tax=Paracoccus albus TaxID=3017784 RepID=UPI0022F0A9C7|nr:DNA polymerase Y family protein [Paracoccus albus]WBU59240.1 DNA polymerase Y family protein [Paracoccus albus]
MFDGANRRTVSLWFPRLASDRALRLRPVEGPFALTLKQDNTDRIHCLNIAAERQRLHRGMAFSEARAFCPDLQSRPADPPSDRRFLMGLRRWATRYCPWVGIEGEDGLVMDVTGSAHLAGGEPAMLDDLRQRLSRVGLAVQIGLGDTRGAAWALARYGEGVAAPGAARAALDPLPVAGLRLDGETVTALQRLGLRTIGQLAEAARAPLARRFGPGLLMRLDQALGVQPEQISPQSEPPHYGVRMSLPEPIGLEADVMAGTERLLTRLCDKLIRHEAGARVLCLTLRRVDSHARHVELRLARPLRDPARILPLFQRGIDEVDAGYGIDQLRLEATQVEPLPAQQISHVTGDKPDRLDDLISRIGTRIGLENILRFLPADSHIPERSFIMAPAAYSKPTGGWNIPRPRPLVMFRPEAIAALSARPPQSFRWRRMAFTTMRATGPERILPEWWIEDESWRHGARDYWRIETHQGHRLWLFYTPQNPGWFIQGVFP